MDCEFTKSLQEQATEKEHGRAQDSVDIKACIGTQLFAGPPEKEGCCSEPPGNSGVESGEWASVPESLLGSQ